MERDDIADLTHELRAILNEWEPIGVADVSPSEYDELNGSILGCLSRCHEAGAFSEWFSTAAEGFCREREELDTVALRLFVWFESKERQQELDERPRPQLRKGRRWRSSHWKA